MVQLFRHPLSKPIPPEYQGLQTCEAAITAFGKVILQAIGFAHGVFHIEARERADGRLALIEVNPRAPGGSLWKSALLRTGYDLEAADISIQLGRKPERSELNVKNYVLHYPFYAPHPGVLSSWGDLDGPRATAIEGLSIDFATDVDTVFREDDMTEEPYLAFAVAHDATKEGILAKCNAILQLTPPRFD
jgi:biotin carboxylase